MPCAMMFFHYFIIFSKGQLADGTKPFRELVIIGQPLGNPGLLQHDLGEPYKVWIVRFSPWEITFMMVIPLFKLSLKKGFRQNICI